jgi:hypothetical protein
MNAKVLLPAAIIGLFFLNSKKPPKSSKSETVEEKEEVEEIEEEKPAPAKPAEPVYKTLTQKRKQLVDQYLKDLPMETIEPIPFGKYMMWASDKQKSGVEPLYQNWLANQAYWQISRLEGKTDLYTDLKGYDIMGYTGEFPYVLQFGKKAILDDQDGFKIVDFTETQEASNKRLAKGIALWTDLNNYIFKNIKSCPQGAYCGK